MKLNGFALTNHPIKLFKTDKEVVSEAVTHYGYALLFASEELKADKEVVLKAVMQNGYALEYEFEALKTDKEVVLKAVKQNGLALKFASKDFKAKKRCSSCRSEEILARARARL